MTVMQDGFLEAARIGSRTRHQYLKQADLFYVFVKALKFRVATTAALDNALVRYLEALYRNGQGIFAARCAVFGVIHDKRLPLRDPTILSRARESLSGWTRLLPDSSRDPLPYVFLCSAAGHLFKQGDPTSRDAGRALLLQFDAYL